MVLFFLVYIPVVLLLILLEIDNISGERMKVIGQICERPDLGSGYADVRVKVGTLTVYPKTQYPDGSIVPLIPEKDDVVVLLKKVKTRATAA